jgi:hypothetical protein
MMKARPIIIIVVTLIIGFILGMLTSAQIRYHRLKSVRMYFSEDRFKNGFYEIIQPDVKQKETIDKLLQKYGRVNFELQNDMRRKMDSTMKEFRKELEPNLTKDQLTRLKDNENRRTEMLRNGRRGQRDSADFRDNRRMGPPQGGRPPFRGPGGQRGESRDTLRSQHDKE